MPAYEGGTKGDRSKTWVVRDKKGMEGVKSKFLYTQGFLLSFFTSLHFYFKLFTTIWKLSREKGGTVCLAKNIWFIKFHIEVRMDLNFV